MKTRLSLIFACVILVNLLQWFSPENVKPLHSQTFTVNASALVMTLVPQALDTLYAGTYGGGGFVPHQTAPVGVIDYYALGDSIASGHGLMDDGTECHRSYDRSYPARVADALENRYATVNLHLLACSGARALKPRAADLAKEPYKWLRNQVHDVAAELETLPADRMILITINIGANDFEWAEAGVIKRLFQDYSAYTVWANKKAAKVAKAVKLDVAELLSAHENAAVVISELYNPLNKRSRFFQVPINGANCVSHFKTADCYKKIEYGIRMLNSTLTVQVVDASGSARVSITSGLHDLFHKHESPRPSCGSKPPEQADTWIQYIGDPNSNSVLPGILSVLGTPGDCFHPNDIGAEKYAGAVNSAALGLGR